MKTHALPRGAAASSDNKHNGDAADESHMLGRRTAFGLAAGAATALVSGSANAFGEAGAFDPRVLLTGDLRAAAHPTAPARWSRELISRTSAPARAEPSKVRADAEALLHAPFAYWSGGAELAALSDLEVSNLRRFLALGGILVVDDANITEDGDAGPFGRSARREMGRVLPGAAAVSLGPEHVMFRSYYILRRAEGRVQGKRNVSAIVRNGDAQVIFLQHDLGGALAYAPARGWEQPVVPGGDGQRERAIRLAVNIAMYALCTNYKDDQVHAPYIMRRRASLGSDE